MARIPEKTGIFIFAFFLVFLAFFGNVERTTAAEEEFLNLVLYTGKVYLLNVRKQRVLVRVGQKINLGKHPWIELENGSKVFLQQGNKLIEVRTPGRHRLAELLSKKSVNLINALSFLKRITKPSVYITQSRVRGDLDFDQQAKVIFFEDLWREIVLESSEKPTVHAARDLIAAAAWYQAEGNSSRVVYILERLNSATHNGNSFYKRLRTESLRGINLVKVSEEIGATRRLIKSEASMLPNKALLIGIDIYDDPVWHRLKTPVQDVEAIRRMLIENYHFRDRDIVVLRNVGFDGIISAFNTLKKEVSKDSNLLVYFAGHGFYPADEKEGYWIPKDAGPPETQRLFLPTSMILGKIRALEAKHILLIADSCFSGSLIRKSRGMEIQSRFYKELSRKMSRQIITSGGIEPVSDQGWGNHSVFAEGFLSILAKKRSEPLSASELALNLRKEVKNAEEVQTPEYGRLHMAGDEKGEYFFVRRDQQIADLIKTEKSELRESPLRKPVEPAFKLEKRRQDRISTILPSKSKSALLISPLSAFGLGRFELGTSHLLSSNLRGNAGLSFRFFDGKPQGEDDDSSSASEQFMFSDQHYNSDLLAHFGIDFLFPIKLGIFRFLVGGNLLYSSDDGYQYPYINIGTSFLFMEMGTVSPIDREAVSSFYFRFFFPY